MTPCSGMYGKRCSCGQMHGVDTTESTKGLFVSPWFWGWIGGVVVVVLLSGLWELCVAWLRHH